jgi:hypothetical protein
MCKRADGDAVRAGLRHRANVFERNPAGDFYDGPALDEFDGLLHHGRSHVVEQNDVGFACEGFTDILYRFHFDNQGDCAGAVPMGQSAGCTHGVLAFLEQGQMVVFDQQAVAERKPVVGAASQRHRPFLQRSPAGERFPRVENPGGSMADGLAELVRERCDA